ncbi:MAG: type III-B CRISPR module RAMP protein Cmr4 [Fimbriimonadales bacterium]|nr:type III-B CRISPR module RAMP protein Cmr4 [Fimbriimonadales bacterium]
MSKTVAVIRTLTPTHVGTGQAVGLIDQPIARSTATGWPILPAQGLKGVLKSVPLKEAYERHLADGKSADEAVQAAERDLADVFGHPDKGLGSLRIAEAQLVLFPVRSGFGTYALVTCPLALENLAILAGLAGMRFQAPKVPDAAGGSDGKLPVWLCTGSALQQKGLVVFDEYDLQPQSDASLGDSAAESLAGMLRLERDHLTKRLAIVGDDLFTHLVRFCTEVRTTTALEVATKKVKQGTLRTAEFLPPYAVFAAYAEVPDEWLEDASPFHDPVVQLGANESTGAGIARIHWSRP